MSAARPPVLLMGDTLNFGGTEGQFVEVACGLDRTRWELDVACIRAEGPLRTKLETAGIQAWSCGRGSFKSPRLLGAIRALSSRLRARKVGHTWITTRRCLDDYLAQHARRKLAATDEH